MSQDVTVAEKTENPLLKPVKVPTPRNLQMYDMYVTGMSEYEIAKLQGLSQATVHEHIAKVSNYFKNDWRTIQQNRLKLKNDRVLNSFDQLVEQNNPQVVINHLNKLIYPDSKVKIESTKLNVIAVKADLSINSDIYDSNVVEAVSQIVDSVIDDDSEQTDAKQASSNQQTSDDSGQSDE